VPELPGVTLVPNNLTLGYRTVAVWKCKDSMKGFLDAFRLINFAN